MGQVAEWLWRVTQDLILSVYKTGVFSWALPAGVRIPSCSFFFSFLDVLVADLVGFSKRYARLFHPQ